MVLHTEGPKLVDGDSDCSTIGNDDGCDDGISDGDSDGSTIGNDEGCDDGIPIDAAAGAATGHVVVIKSCFDQSVVIPVENTALMK